MMTLPPERQAFLDGERSKWLSVREAAFVLRISPDKVFAMVHHKTLPARHDGKVIRIHVDDLRPNQGGPDVATAE